MAGVPVIGRRRPGCHSSPPERFFGLVGDIAPGDADVVEFPIGPLGQFAARPVALPPDMEGFGQSGSKSPVHDDLSSIHGCKWTFSAPVVICWSEYLLYPSLPQTTLCTVSDDINSCIWGSRNDRQAAVAEWIARLRGRGPASELHPGRVRAERHADRDQPSDQAAGGRARRSPVHPPEPFADADAAGAGISPRHPRRLQRSQACDRPPAAQGRRPCADGLDAGLARRQMAAAAADGVSGRASRHRRAHHHLDQSGRLPARQCRCRESATAAASGRASAPTG